MPRFFRNRKAEEVKKFLEAHGYRAVHMRGDDEIWAKGGCQFTVKLPSRNETMPDGTMDYVKRMMNMCGHSRKEILAWWKKNGFGE